MTTRKNIIGNTYGQMTVVEYSHTNQRKEAVWICKCKCGKIKQAKTRNLIACKVKSCGCIKTGKSVESLVGLRFNRLVVVKYSHSSKHRVSHWICLCDCGNQKVISQRALVTKATNSCGCLKQVSDNNRRGKNNPNYRESLTDQDRIGGRIFEGYKEWTKLVKSQFDYKCDICHQSPSGGLVSHHLESYDVNPELRIDLTNGVCLCKLCHSDFHKLYGFGNNTKDQYLFFKIQRQIECLRLK